MQLHSTITNKQLHLKIRREEICFGGNLQLKIYGLLSCKSGKRMKREKRVFFTSEQEAVGLGYRPCGHCMKAKYEQWKIENV